MKNNVNLKVKVIYDARPLQKDVKECIGEVIKITPSGLWRIKAEFIRDNGTKGEYNELFDPYTGKAKGWDTLRFERIAPHI